MNFQLITTQAELANLIDHLASSEILYLDTEFVRERTLFPHFGLLQLSDGEQLWLIDPIAVTDLSTIWPILQDPNRLIVLHAFSEDLELLWSQGQVELTNVLDTQVAASMLGWGTGLGFAALVEMETGVELDKSHSRTNWLQRPLTEQQLRYAADDVLYLAPVAKKLIQELKQNQLWFICMDECKRLAKRTQKPLNQRYLDVKNAWQLNPQQLAVLRELAAWRYQRAQTKDMALNFVIKELALIDVAKRQPDSLAQLKQLADISPIEARIHGERLLKLVSAGKSVAPNEWPEPIYRVVDIPNYKQLQKSLAKLIKQQAERIGLPETVLASKRLQTEYLMWAWRQTSSEQSGEKPVLLQGWRFQLMQEPLQQWQRQQ